MGSKRGFLILLTLLLAGAITFSMLALQSPGSNQSVRDARSAANIGDHFKVEVASTPDERTRGLSGRERLARNAGMLFVFDNPGHRCMWMKDMNFSLDMVWLNAGKQIIKIEHDVRPETFPQSFCADGAQYVLEVNSGQIKKLGWQAGQHLRF